MGDFLLHWMERLLSDGIKDWHGRASSFEVFHIVYTMICQEYYRFSVSCYDYLVGTTSIVVCKN